MGTSTGVGKELLADSTSLDDGRKTVCFFFIREMASELYKVQQEANRLCQEIRDARAKLWLTRIQGCATIDKLLWEHANISHRMKDALEELDRVRNECQMLRSEIAKRGLGQDFALFKYHRLHSSPKKKTMSDFFPFVSLTDEEKALFSQLQRELPCLREQLEDIQRQEGEITSSQARTIQELENLLNGAQVTMRNLQEEIEVAIDEFFLMREFSLYR
ncbi:unnamed protein product [Nippostrongylus brasiliensis]|uniref:t-SNARE coiled-coil homology domain-containing protein n=1 Tax=Nippostrongylus brasiliensis TaxID=27835 RepID=A0A0N4YE68_NIPBR|nr:unnamed protein product [Nippostrongylus brasiliensis]